MIEREGVIKFNCDRHRYQAIAPFPELVELTAWRRQLYDLGMIGQDQQGIGYGNVSINTSDGLFITASQTGHQADLALQDYVQILNYDSTHHTLVSQGQKLPSSETLTHYAIYQISSEIKAVFHIHHGELWRMMLANGYLHTPADVAYGTQAMAQAVLHLYRGLANPFDQNLLAMAGHENGIFSFGRTCREAGQALLSLYSSIGLTPTF